jgi:hypothetical protein
MKITIAANASQAVPPFDDDVGRVTVLLGANGSGKSRLLKAMIQSLGENYAQPFTLNPRGDIGDVKLEPIIPSVQANQQLANHIQNQIGALNVEARTLRPEQYVLTILRSMDAERRDARHDALDLHLENPKQYAKPSPFVSTVDEFCSLFNQSLDVKISLNKLTGSFECQSSAFPANELYTTSALSTGEKWIFRTLPIFIAYKDEAVTLFVDEPETSLNEQLAVSFWSLLERERPNWSFIYATHNVNFAARDSVDSLYLLRSPSQKPLLIADVQDLDPHDRRSLLGVAPLLLQSKKALFVEGKNLSVDRPFYKAALNMSDVYVTSLGACTEVAIAVDKQAHWQKLELQNLVIRGVVDCDYRSNDYISHLTHDRLAVLPLHDLEAYLCLPDVLCALAYHVAGIVDPKHYSDLICSHARSNKRGVLVRHANHRFNLMRTLSLDPADHKEGDAPSIASAYAKIREEVLSEFSGNCSDFNIETTLLQLEHNIDQAINNADIEALLRLFSGKRLFEELKGAANLAGKDLTVAMIAKHKLFGQVPKLIELRNLLQGLFAS